MQMSLWRLIENWRNLTGVESGNFNAVSTPGAPNMRIVPPSVPGGSSAQQEGVVISMGTDRLRGCSQQGRRRMLRRLEADQMPSVCLLASRLCRVVQWRNQYIHSDQSLAEKT